MLGVRMSIMRDRLGAAIERASPSGIQTVIGLITAVSFFTGLLAATSGRAQEDAKARSGLEVWKSAGCSMCHGSFADGNNQNDDYPMGANLRATRLDAAELKLTIGCGRPGTGMPSFDKGAYNLRPCYERPLGDAPNDLYPAPAQLNSDQIDAVIAYLQARIIGRGKITKEECVAYYDGYDSDLCADYQ
jgi:mono/diheme cytochrome c family protein